MFLSRFNETFDQKMIGSDSLTALILRFFMLLLKYSELTVTWCDLTGNRWTSLSCKKIAKA